MSPLLITCFSCLFLSSIQNFNIRKKWQKKKHVMHHLVNHRHRGIMLEALRLIAISYGYILVHAHCTILPAKSDSDVMFCLQSY